VLKAQQALRVLQGHKALLARKVLQAPKVISVKLEHKVIRAIQVHKAQQATLVPLAQLDPQVRLAIQAL
jgi:hypothetical protein